VPSSWKLDTSTTNVVACVEPSTRETRGAPMLPPTRASKPASRSIAPRAAVVVDLPFVPVIAATRPSRWRKASSSSAITGTPAWRAASSSGRSQGTPGDTTTIEAPVKVPTRCPPSSSRTPRSRSWRTSSLSSPSVFVSVATTCAPRRARNSAAAIPERASPITTTAFPSTPLTAASAS
jgi:hypothetical protein